MRKRTTKKAAIGSAFDDFLKDEGTYEATQQVAIKRAEMARRMETSRSQLDRLLDPESSSSDSGNTDPCCAREPSGEA
jgi:antitoxin HicB